MMDASDVRTEPVRRNFLPLVPIAVLSTVFGAISGNAVGASPAMAAFGLAWGVIAILAAPRLARIGASSPRWADASVIVTLAVGLLALGGAVQGVLQDTTPELVVTSMQTTKAYWFFPVMHMLFEWVLLPAAIVLNWANRRRALLIMTAGIFYLFRVASALYFAPKAMGWGQLPLGTPITSELHAEIEVWLRLNWLRFGFQDLLTTVLLAVACYHPRFATRSHAGSSTAGSSA